MAAGLLGSIEAGGTKWVCAVGTGPHDIVASMQIPTTTPSETFDQVMSFFQAQAPIRALGVASFGPLELRPAHSRFGFITATPKTGWTDTDLVGTLEQFLDVPIGLDTDVNGAALGERGWGAAQDVDSFVYVTVGTGIGGGAVVSGEVAHGLVHPEMGHLGVARHRSDLFPGTCPFHGDCWEGMASGSAMTARWGTEFPALSEEVQVRARELEAYYLAQGLRNLVYTIAPERIVLGGGVSKIDGLFPAVRAELNSALAGYPGLPEHGDDQFVVPPGLGDRSGIAGGFALAELALG